MSKRLGESCHTSCCNLFPLPRAGEGEGEGDLELAGEGVSQSSTIVPIVITRLGESYHTKC